MEDSTIIQMSSVVSMEQLDNDDDDDVVFENNNRNVNLCEINTGNTNKLVCSAQRPMLVEEQREDKDSSFDNDTNNKGDNSNNDNESKRNDNVSKISIAITTNESHEIDEENDSDVIILPMTSNSDVTTLESLEQVNESSIHYSNSQQHEQLEEEHEEREEVQNKELASPSLTESTILTELTAIVPTEDRDNKEMNLQVTHKLRHNEHKKPSSETKERECTQPIMQLYKVEDEDDEFTSNTIAQEEDALNNKTNIDNENVGSATSHDYNEQESESRNTEWSNNSARKELECNSGNMKHDIMKTNEKNVYSDYEGDEGDASENTNQLQSEEQKVEMSHAIEGEQIHCEEEEKEENQQEEKHKEEITAQENFQETNLDETDEVEQEEEYKEDEEEMEVIEDEINVEANIDEVDDDQNDENDNEDHEDESVEEEQSSQEEEEEQQEEDMANEYSHTYNNYYKPQLSLGQQR